MDIITLFCHLDSSNMAQLIELAGITDSEAEVSSSFEIIKEVIIHELLQMGVTLNDAYPHIAKYLFTGENAAKPSHKQMFWRVFGDIAADCIRDNLENCSVCPGCGEKIPAWDTAHLCPANNKGMHVCVCIDCGTLTNRTNSRQCRCDACQSQYRKDQERIRVRKYRNQGR